jgi:ribosomal protein S18 acetylase RimI-like enzyme
VRRCHPHNVAKHDFNSSIHLQSEQTEAAKHANNRPASLVEQTNALSIQDFIAKYVTPLTQGDSAESDEINQSIQAQDANATPPMEIYSAATISAPDLEACLDLIEQTSSEDYAAAASDGWSRTKKRKEMKLLDMKYLILRDVPKTGSESSGTDAVAEKQSEVTDEKDPSEKSDEPVPASNAGSPSVLGFLSFMITYEDGKEVVYCYEIHLSPTARGRGVGRMLMDRMEGIGRAVGLDKAMLTVFKSNEVARRFYERLGYGVDEFSPRPRMLRNGTIKEYGYLILSKRLKL